MLLEFRQQHALFGICLYIASTIFIIYLSMGQPDADVWKGLFWVVQLFVCVNAVSKSFLQDSKGRMLYYNNIAGAKDYVLSKILHNSCLMVMMTTLSVILFFLLLGNPILYLSSFFGLSILGGISLSLVFTFLAAIAAKAQQQAALMAIMGFPLIIPQLLLLMKISNIAFGTVQEGFLNLVMILLALDAMIVALSIILFPFLWKD